ncbi:isoleucine--tRNA ligase [Parvularcula flava]|uniref:Isoleucine--tRNA ligase n=1 Tax=Aquisalinus luteolus TaxID=1566827 RepID=A0A8J3ERE4_9PROT|nr:isoleucine--tRNA ligase [Aquisalinus luteolus]NHK28615.1 isoleucine--tRNA ligase [Aquisalinus luteolus]GGH99009.1 isoleucine--tRNA ligase [Aquisalinus luteolus]
MADDKKAPSGRDYRDTLFLPTTDFPMRAGLPKAEPEHLKRWEEMGLYEKLRVEAADRPAFTLHDGPPYANGHLHIGHALNKVLKDIVVRSRQMSGFNANYVPGWDCHGLPIEWQVEKQYKEKGKAKADVPPSEFRQACRDYAAKWIDIQKGEFRRLGIEGDWADPYTTMKFASEAAIVGEFLKFIENGLVYRGAKPVMWSPVEQTALAEAEVEYHDRKVPVIWVKFPVKNADNTSVVIWTTTPWTIPSNQAVSYNTSISYGVYEVTAVMSEEELGFAPYAKVGEKLLLADALADSVKDAAKISEWTRVADAEDPASYKLSHPLAGLDPFWQHDIAMLAGDHVTDDAGTGFVHTAPAHGEDDYNVFVASGRSTGDIRQIVDESGCYTDEVPEPLRGLDIIRTSGKKLGEPGKANPEVMRLLAEQGTLLARGLTTIRDAHSWRSKAPVIRRATPQWFIRMGGTGTGGLRDTALQAIADTKFYPESGRNRIRTMVEGRPDWLVSRQRAWGVPITIFASKKTGEPLNDEAVNNRIRMAIAERGADAWFDTPAQDFLGDKYKAEDYEKVEDILDVWFDSGSTHAFVLEGRNDLTAPADLYLEGSDQHRGWFQSSLLESCGTRGRAPYKAVLTHGFVLDEQGRKMSKTEGNVTDPAEVTQKYGADILRIWVASADYSEDLRIGEEIIGSAVDGYRKLRNTLRYLLGAVANYAPTEEVEPEDMPELERYVLHLLHKLDGEITAAYQAYDFKTVWRRLSDFCSIDLSSLYLDIRKDSLYCDRPDDPGRMAARTVMNILLDYLMRWLAPICPFTAEEAYLSRHPEQSASSVHLRLFLQAPEEWKDEALAGKWGTIRKVRRVITGALEVERREKRIGASLEAAPVVHIEDKATLETASSVDMAELCITSAITLTGDPVPANAFRMEDIAGIGVVPARADGGKCSRCWRILPEVTETHELCNRCEDAVAAHDKVAG